MANTQLVAEKLPYVNSLVYSFLEVKQDEDDSIGSYTEKSEDLGKVMFFDPWSGFAKPEGFTWGNHLKDPTVKWISEHVDYFPEKSLFSGAVFDPQNPNFPYDWLNFGNFQAFAKSNVPEKIIGIGGYGDQYLPGWEAAVDHPDNFAKSIIEISKYFGINGVDLDWEPLSDIDNACDIIDLAEAIREEANAQNLPNFKISFPITVDPDQIENFDKYYFGSNKTGAWKELMQYVDHISVMGYDMHGAFDANKKTGLHSTLYETPNDPSGFSTHGAIQLLLEYDVPSDHIILGIPAYSRGVTGVAKECLNESFTGPYNQANYDPSAGISSYRNIVNNFDDKTTNIIVKDPNGEEVITGAYAYFDGNFLSFDSVESTIAKTQYAIDNNLAGMLTWPIEQDSADDHCLLKTISDTYHDHGTFNYGIFNNTENYAL